MAEFVNVGQFVEHPIDRLSDGDTQGLGIVFDVIEQVVAHVESKARSLIIDGFLDDLASLGLYSTVSCRPVDCPTLAGTPGEERAVASALPNTVTDRPTLRAARLRISLAKAGDAPPRRRAGHRGAHLHSLSVSSDVQREALPPR
jgi:hypothetical protein